MPHSQLALMWQTHRFCCCEGKLWNSWHNNTVKNTPWKGGPLQKGLAAFTFPFLCSVLCPGGSWRVEFSYCSPPTESSPWEICPLSYYLLGNRHLWWSESQCGGEHTLNENAFQIHSHRWRTGLLSNSGSYITKAHGFKTDINRNCMHKIYSRW